MINHLLLSQVYLFLLFRCFFMMVRICCCLNFMYLVSGLGLRQWIANEVHFARVSTAVFFFMYACLFIGVKYYENKGTS